MLTIIPGVLIAGAALHAASVIATGVVGGYTSYKQVALDLIPFYGLYKSVKHGLTGR